MEKSYLNYIHETEAASLFVYELLVFVSSASRSLSSIIFVCVAFMQISCLHPSKHTTHPRNPRHPNHEKYCCKECDL